MTAVTHQRTPTPSIGLAPFRGGRLYGWLVGLALILAAVSLLWPSTPSYDPWSWLIWGRQILHGHLWIAGGSSWKPLPVLFTTVFALFGSAQPNLWLIVARAGAVLSVLMSAKLAARITWNLAVQAAPRGWVTDLGPGQRVLVAAPAVGAAVIALIGTGFMPRYPVPMMLGYSEGLGFALALIAIERAWDGHHVQAFALGLLPCLDRPELWIVWGLYGLWLMWRERGRMIPFVIGLGVLMLLLWVVPQRLGGANVSGLIGHATSNHLPGSAVNSTFPFWHELYLVLWPLALERVEVAALLMIGLAAVLVLRDRRAGGSWIGAVRRHGAAATGALAGAAGFAWLIGISIETQIGFAGNPRYAVLGVLLVYVGGASAYGWAAVGVARLIGAGARRVRDRGVAAAPSLGVAAVLMMLAFLFLPGWFTHRLPSVRGIRYALRYQAQLREQVAALVRTAGGAKKVMACGSVMTNNYQVTLVAWYLDVPIPFVQALPPKQTSQPAVGPNVVFQDGAVSDTPRNIGPKQMQMRAWNEGWKAHNHTQYRVIKTYPVTLYTDCSQYSGT
ncbi:MAG TPA: hypothetical protein VFP55_01130 [Solirubrobacteraceae bacterium]|nr:hypothetical protein [Solirubrobacteraceae bacterium]